MLGVFNISMPRLTVTLNIPFESEPLVDRTLSITHLSFTHWLPVGRDQGIVVEDGDIQIVLWFDEKCTWWGSQPTAEELKKHIEVPVFYVNAEVEITGLSDGLLNYIQDRDFPQSPDETDKVIQFEYERLAKRVLASVIQRVNRLIAFARSHKGQDRLTEYKIDFDRLRSYFIEFESSCQIDDGPWVRFQPPTTDRLTVSLEGESTYITEDDWPAFRDFVPGPKT